MKEFRQILGYTKDLRGSLILIAALSTLSAIVTFATPLIMKFGTDWAMAVASGSVAFDASTLVVVIGLLILSSLLGVVFSDIGGVLGDIVAMKTRKQLSQRYFSHLLKLPQRYFDVEVTGKIINRLSRAVVDMTSFLQFFANNLLQMLLTLIITIVILLFYSWPLAVLLLLLIPTNLYVTAKTSKRWMKYEKKKNKHFDIASGRFAEVISQMRLVKSFGSERNELKSFVGHHDSMLTIVKPQSVWWHSMNAVRTVIFGLIFAAIYGVLFYNTAKGNFTLGDLVFLLTIVQQIAFPMRNLSYFVDSYQRALANSRDYIDALAEVPEDDDGDSQELVVSEARLVFDSLVFSYGDSKKVLDGVSFDVESGQKVALVGESGSGKTTLTNILMRMYDPSEGSISIDGRNLADYRRSEVRKCIATVFQDAELFSGTIKENIAYAVPDATENDILNAAKSANALQFIDEFQDGLDTEIGERGIKLSGGQRQRIAIARAILKDAPILILDEATSALDSRSEMLVQDALNRLMKNRTTLIIAHRLSTISHVDKIVTMAKGSVEEIGTPTQLAKSGGVYSQLLELQASSTDKSRKKLEDFGISG